MWRRRKFYLPLLSLMYISLLKQRLQFLHHHRGAIPADKGSHLQLDVLSHIFIKEVRKKELAIFFRPVDSKLRVFFFFFLQQQNNQ